jgi:hypothetical protein
MQRGCHDQTHERSLCSRRRVEEMDPSLAISPGLLTANAILTVVYPAASAAVLPPDPWTFPVADARLKPTELSATAAGNAARGTSSEITACQASPLGATPERRGRGSGSHCGSAPRAGRERRERDSNPR